MRLILAFILALSLFFTACLQNTQKPENLISKEEMKVILRDIYLYRSLNEVDIAKGSTLVLDDVNLAVLEQHKVSVKDFEDSYKYYLLTDEAYGEILQEIKKELSANEVLPKQDSITE